MRREKLKGQGKGALGLPSQIGVQLVFRNSKGFQSMSDGVLRIFNVHSDRVGRRVVTVVGSPVPATHLFVLRPAIKRPRTSLCPSRICFKTGVVPRQSCTF